MYSAPSVNLACVVYNAEIGAPPNVAHEKSRIVVDSALYICLVQFSHSLLAAVSPKFNQVF